MWLIWNLVLGKEFLTVIWYVYVGGYVCVCVHVHACVHTPMLICVCNLKHCCSGMQNHIELFWRLHTSDWMLHLVMHVIKKPPLITLKHSYFNLTVCSLRTDRVRGLKRLTHFSITEVL
jgi:hypothetical protein